MVFQAARRIAQLDAAHEGLVFGRLDLRDELDPEPRYVGRIGLRDDNRDSLLIDWRAPAAAVFYQATAAEPHDVVRRRVLRCSGPRGHRRRGRAARRRGRHRPADRRRGRADGAALAGPRPLDALDRRDHPGRAGPGDPRTRQGRRLDLRRARHRQDGGRAAPRGVPALHRPPPLRGRRRADRRPQRRLHALHRAGAARRSARPRSRCARWARSSTASAPPATTSRRSPTSRARPGWRSCCGAPRGSRRPAARRSSGSSGATT